MKKRFAVLFLSFVLTNISAFFPAFAQSQNKPLVIPEGTQIQLAMREPVSSKLSEVGDEVQAVVKKDVVVDGVTLLREGALVIGRVTVAKPAKRPLKGGMLHLSFDHIRLQDGLERKLTAVVQSASNFSRDEKISSNGEGTLKGGKVGDNAARNATIGAVVGVQATVVILARDSAISGGRAAAAAGAIGAGVLAGILLTKSKEVRLDPGTVVRLKLERPLSIE